jgi:predicted amidohydrolase
MRIALAQTDSSAHDLEANLQTHVDYIERAIAESADLVVFPELSLSGDNTGPDADIRKMQLTLNDPRLEPLRTLSEKIDVVFGMLEDAGAQQYNASLYLHNGAVQHVHRKVFLANYATFNEKAFAAPGAAADTFDSDYGRTSLLICNDCWHPILPYMAALEGAELLLVPSNSARSTMGDQLAIRQIWENANRTYAGMLNVYVIFVNRVGPRYSEEERFQYWGGSEIIGPQGNAVVKADYDEAALVFADIDLDALRAHQQDTAIFADLNPTLLRNKLNQLL